MVATARYTGLEDVLEAAAARVWSHAPDAAYWLERGDEAPAPALLLALNEAEAAAVEPRSRRFARWLRLALAAALDVAPDRVEAAIEAEAEGDVEHAASILASDVRRRAGTEEAVRDLDDLVEDWTDSAIDGGDHALHATLAALPTSVAERVDEHLAAAPAYACAAFVGCEPPRPAAELAAALRRGDLDALEGGEAYTVGECRVLRPLDEALRAASSEEGTVLAAACLVDSDGDVVAAHEAVCDDRTGGGCDHAWALEEAHGVGAETVIRDRCARCGAARTRVVNPHCRACGERFFGAVTERIEPGDRGEVLRDLLAFDHHGDAVVDVAAERGLRCTELRREALGWDADRLAEALVAAEAGDEAPLRAYLGEVADWLAD